MLKDLPDDNTPLDVPELVTIREDACVTMDATGDAPMETGVAPMETFSKSLKSLGIFNARRTHASLYFLTSTVTCRQLWLCAAMTALLLDTRSVSRDSRLEY